ncbi:MAG: DUF4421 family protein, partial [Bacteroidota bacterium]
ITCRLFTLFQNAAFMINPDNLNVIVYKPNVNFRIGISGMWKWFGMGLSIENPFYKRNNETFGKTTFLDLRANAFGRAVAAELFLQRYRGFYISDPHREDGSHYIIPDMSAFSLGISVYWIYNASRFSIRAAFVQNERQKKSAGSFMVRPSFLFSSITSTNGIIPAEIVNQFHIPSTDLVTDGDIYSFGLSPGYSYTIIFLKYFYLTATIFPAVSWQYYVYKTTKNSYIENEFSFHLGGQFAIGYNSEYWFIGGSVQAGIRDIPRKLTNTYLNYDVEQFRIWGGTRFDWFRKKKK